MCFYQLTLVGRRTLTALERRELPAERVHAGEFVPSLRAWGISI
jgi:hypothetical protein